MSASSIKLSSSGQTKSKAALGDVLLTGVVAMLAINVLQRVVGLGRSLGFCHFLSEDQLGAWALIHSFFGIGVPLAVLGLPGSFSKFAEHYRHRGQLGNFLRALLPISCIGSVVAIGWMLLSPSGFSWLVFDSHQPYSVVVLCGFAFASLIAFSIVQELINSLRHVRVVAIMQAIQSIGFAVIGLPWIALGESWVYLLPSFAIASLLGMMPGVWIVCRLHASELVAQNDFERSRMWKRVIPFAVSLWFMNLLSNLFDISDRYMLLHLIGGSLEQAQAAVGQYHCGRILPNLMTSLALVLGGILLPYLSADWERGQQDRIKTRVRQMVQSTCIGFMALAVGALVVSPLLFEYGLGGRYQPAESVLPMLMLQAIWVGLFLIAEAYMLCVEKGKQLAVLLAAGLVVNVILNYFLIRETGLDGAVVATTSSAFVTWIALFWLMGREGYWLGWNTSILCLCPMAVLGGPIVLGVVLFLVLMVVSRTDWLLTDLDKTQIDEVVIPKLSRIGINMKTLWPSRS